MQEELYTKPKVPNLPPGTPPTVVYSGPWLQTQLVLSLSIGITSFLLFSYCRTRWPVLFAPRTKLKAFSPHEAHIHQSMFAWIIPTIRTPELTVLQIVGLDAAVLLNFFKMSFYLFSFTSIFALFVILPLNIYMNAGTDYDNGDPDGGEEELRRRLGDGDHEPDWSDIINASNSFRAVQLLFTYVFTLLVMRALNRNYRQFVRVRQLSSLELVHSIAGRTVMITNLPQHLQAERTLAVYFENMGFQVESVNVVRHAGNMRVLIYKRTEALLKLETAWTNYVGNPSGVETYDPSKNVHGDNAPLIELHGADGNLESQPTRLVVPHRERPTVRPRYFKSPVDALEFYQNQFDDLDEQVRKKRRTGKFKATSSAFVTFEKMSDAQIAAQVVHAPHQSQSLTYLAPEPRDIVWSNMTLTPQTLQMRQLMVLGFMVFLFLFWIVPVTFLASLLSYEEIKKALPWLAKLIDSSDTIRALVQNSLPSVSMMLLNAVLPFLLEGLAYLQGYQARSWIEYSLMRKYFLFLLVNVLFIFLFASTYWQLFRDLANSPAKIPTKLAAALSVGRARNFFMSYVILQALGVMPLQLLNLGVIIPRFLYLALFTRTPRDFAELNAPPMINYGAVYPQAIFVFVITITYSVILPQIMAFGALYFGIGYVVYKYKLLFVFYKPYESQGQAWPIAFVRLVWALLIFQLLMTGIFTLEKYFTLSTLMAPIILFTVYWGWTTYIHFSGLASFVSLSSVCEVQRGEDSDEVARLRAGANPVSWSQSNLNRRRYAQNDETLYVAPEDDRTDYSQPPMANWFFGVLNTGKRRYGHPALTGVLPTPWLPLKKGQTLANHVNEDDARMGDGNAVVLTLRRRYSTIKRRAPSSAKPASGEPATNEAVNTNADPTTDASASTDALLDPWKDSTQPRPSSDPGPSTLDPSAQQKANHRLSFDPATGVITLPDGQEWLDGDESDSDYGDTTPGAVDSPADPGEEGLTTGDVNGSSILPSKRHSTYFHHPERRKHHVPGAFPLIG